MKLRTLILTLESSGRVAEDASKLRGFFATRFSEYALLHQHNVDRLIYGYPLVQYKMIGGVPMVVGVNEGAEVLEEVYDKFDVIRLGDSVYEIVERGISVKKVDFGLTDKIHSYEFLSPWLALNQENYRRFYGMKGRGERDEFLRKILIGNLLSMSKSLGYQVPSRIKCDVRVRIRKNRLKDVRVMGFVGGFQCNFLIPDFLGVGKSVSRGFGVVKHATGD